MLSRVQYVNVKKTFRAHLLKWDFRLSGTKVYGLGIPLDLNLVCLDGSRVFDAASIRTVSKDRT